MSGFPSGGKYLPQERSRKVLLVCDSLGGGGAERQLALLATHLAAPWQVTVISLGGGIYADVLREAGIELIMIPRRFRFDPSPLLAMSRAIRDLRPEVVHSWGHMACMAADPVCRIMRIPHVAGVIRRGSIHSLRGRLPQLASRFGDIALANSRAGLEAFGVPARRGRVLHNGFAPERLERPPAVRRPGEPFHVVMAATMDDRKDYPSLIEAVRRLADETPVRVKATALGGGSSLGKYRGLAEDLIQAGIMEFPGRVDEVMEYLDQAHVGVLLGVAGWGEGISNSIMEYMAAGLPVIATDAGGNPELVVHGETGFLIPPGDVDGLVRHLRDLSEDRERASAMGRAGRSRIEREFSVAAMLDRIGEIYEEVIAMKRSG